MNFKKYSEIENTYQKAYLNKIVEHGLSDGLWCCTEKVHGSNMSFICDGENVSCAKRTEVLSLTSNFFNFQQVFNENKAKVLAIAHGIKYVHPEVTNVYIYGELCGGVYPHPDVPRVLNQSTVQKGVYYSPKNIFYAFDIRVEFAPGEYVWYDWSEAVNLFEMTNMFYAKNLFIGSLDECLKYENTFNTTIPKLLGLPEIENNICEGVVIKPLNEAKHFGNGERVILKNKNDKWTEKAKAPRVPKIAGELTEEQIEKRSVISLFITENRLKNVLSKIGPVEAKDFPKIMKAFVEDISKDFSKEYDMEIYGKEFGRFCGKAAADLIRKNFIDIINNDF